MSTAWYPGWQVSIDGRTAAAGPDAATGRIAFPVPEGRHQVSVAWETTGTRRAATILSLVSLFAIALAEAVSKKLF